MADFIFINFDIDSCYLFLFDMITFLFEVDKSEETTVIYTVVSYPKYGNNFFVFQEYFQNIG